MDALGWLHVGFALAALGLGAAALWVRKTFALSPHTGPSLFFSMLVVNVSALTIYRLTGSFNFFHASALASLFFVMAGMAVALARWPRGRDVEASWQGLHASCMAGSYVGLWAATVAEVAGRTGAGEFYPPGVAVATVVVVVVGVFLMRRYLPPALARLRTRGVE